MLPEANPLRITLSELEKEGWSVDHSKLCGGVRLGPVPKRTKLLGEFEFDIENNVIAVRFSAKARHPYNKIARKFLSFLSMMLLEEGIHFVWEKPRYFEMMWLVRKQNLRTTQNAKGLKQTFKQEVYEGQHIVLGCLHVLASTRKPKRKNSKKFGLKDFGNALSFILTLPEDTEVLH